MFFAMLFIFFRITNFSNPAPILKSRIIPKKASNISADLIITANAAAVAELIPNAPKAKNWIASCEPKAAGMGSITARRLNPRIDKTDKAPTALPRKSINKAVRKYNMAVFRKESPSPSHIALFLNLKKLKISLSISKMELEWLKFFSPKILKNSLAMLSLLKVLK